MRHHRVGCHEHRAVGAVDVEYAERQRPAEQAVERNDQRGRVDGQGGVESRRAKGLQPLRHIPGPAGGGAVAAATDVDRDRLRAVFRDDALQLRANFGRRLQGIDVFKAAVHTLASNGAAGPGG